MADEVVATTPTADALAAPAEGSTATPAAAAAPGDLEALKAKELESYRAEIRKQTIPEQAAVREERRKLNAARKQFEGQQQSANEKLQQMQAELEYARKHPMAYAAKVRGVTEKDIYDERTKRAIDPRAAEMDEVKGELETLRQQRERERAEANTAAAAARAEQIERAFAADVTQHVKSGTYDLVSEYPAENIAAVVLARGKAHFAKTLEEDGEGKVLDIKEILETLESELEQEAEAKAKRLAEKKAKAAAAAGVIPDRGNGAVKPAVPEATSTQPQGTAPAKPGSHKSRRQRLEEAESALLRGD